MDPRRRRHVLEPWWPQTAPPLTSADDVFETVTVSDARGQWLAAAGENVVGRTSGWWLRTGGRGPANRTRSRPARRAERRPLALDQLTGSPSRKWPEPRCSLGCVAMTAADALEIVDLLERVGVEPWVDSGWGVDALLGEQTRPHEDLDLPPPYA